MMSWAMSLARIAHRGEEAEVKRNKKKNESITGKGSSLR